jgi:hypothetical protein
MDFQCAVQAYLWAIPLVSFAQQLGTAGSRTCQVTFTPFSGSDAKSLSESVIAFDPFL